MKSATLVGKMSPSSDTSVLSGEIARFGAATFRLIVRTFFVAFVLSLASARIGCAIEVSRTDAERIGRRIWQNECGGTVAGLTSWNAGEDFASLGIGHFIWYPKDKRGPFEESFPELVNFISARGAKIPIFLFDKRECPWNFRADFLQAQDSSQMKQLRQFLSDTIDLQTQFLVTRLQNSLPKMLAQTTDRENVQRRFDRVGATPQGCYALIDYVNFKGEGTLTTERYHGKGWGLLQVLEEMKDSHSALDEFVDSAKTVLRRRVANSPPARGEERWLRGWLGRVESYREQP
jgi:hypothetical protein